MSRRRTPPFDVEIMALVQLSAVPVMVSLQDGNMVEVTTDSWTTAIDIEGQVRFEKFPDPPRDISFRCWRWSGC